jgi:hypothetical protein
MIDSALPEVTIQSDRAFTAAVLFLVASQLVGRAAISQAASGQEVGQQDALFGIEDLGRFGHEVDAAKDDGRGLNLHGRAGEVETVAGVVGDGLNLAFLIVVGENGGVVFGFEVGDFVEKVLHGEKSLFFVWRRTNPLIRKQFRRLTVRPPIF